MPTPSIFSIRNTYVKIILTPGQTFVSWAMSKECIYVCTADSGFQQNTLQVIQSLTERHYLYHLYSSIYLEEYTIWLFMVPHNTKTCF